MYQQLVACRAVAARRLYNCCGSTCIDMYPQWGSTPRRMCCALCDTCSVTCLIGKPSSLPVAVGLAGCSVWRCVLAVCTLVLKCGLSQKVLQTHTAFSTTRHMAYLSVWSYSTARGLYLQQQLLWLVCALCIRVELFVCAYKCGAGLCSVLASIALVMQRLAWHGQTVRGLVCVPHCAACDAILAYCIAASVWQFSVFCVCCWHCIRSAATAAFSICSILLLQSLV